jgi:DNA-binding transcriptional regulator YdaS (Cro superfamily)
MNTACPASPAEAALHTVLSIVGSRAALARLLNISRPAVAQWRVVPIRRAAEVARLTGLSLGEVCPALARNEDAGMSRSPNSLPIVPERSAE